MKLSMTVRELRMRMSHAEFIRWGMYYARIAQEQELAQLKGAGRAG